jgi:hypothetical protein
LSIQTKAPIAIPIFIRFGSDFATHAFSHQMSSPTNAGDPAAKTDALISRGMTAEDSRGFAIS